MRLPFLRSVRARITVVTTLTVALVLAVAAAGLLRVSRRSLVQDVRGTLTENLLEAQRALNRGVVTELSLLALGLAVDPIDATTDIVDEQCAPILAEAYGERRRPFEVYYYFERIPADTFFEYDDCVTESDPFYEAIEVCDTEAIAVMGDRRVTFAEFQDLVSGDRFESAFAACLDEALLVPEEVAAAAEACDPGLDAAFAEIDVLDPDAVDSAMRSALEAYSACMRASGVEEYPDVALSGLESDSTEISALTGVLGASVVFPSLEEVRKSVAGFETAAVIGVPLLVVLLAVLTWVIVGRVLRPVEAIRSRVAAIGGSDLDQRVPEPGTDDEVGRLATTMNDMLARLEASAGRQAQFVSDASHELRSPLASIRAQLEVALTHPGSSEWSDVAGGVLEESRRMERLVDDLLTLARADEGMVAVASDPVDLGEIVGAEAHRPASPVTVTADGAEAIVAGDALALRRLVRNLVDNAVRHAASRVDAVVVVNATDALLTVDDDGPGVPPAERERVFERFTRLEEARTRDAGGAGLGLAVVREIARSHGGDAHLTDSPLGGTRAVVRIPLA
jgi:signal transduction histidine kinase